DAATPSSKEGNEMTRKRGTASTATSSPPSRPPTGGARQAEPVRERAARAMPDPMLGGWEGAASERSHSAKPTDGRRRRSRVAVLASLLVASASLALAGAPDVSAVITVPIPADVGPVAPPVPVLPLAGDAAPPVSVIADPVEPGAVCGGWSR